MEPERHSIPVSMDEPAPPPLTEGAPLTLADERLEETVIHKRVPWMNLILFVATVFTTLLAGAFQQGADVFQHPAELVRGIPFSFTLMAILLTHEMGHYLASRYHRVQATLPYFIPGPTIIGTFGAFIRMTSPIVNKRALLDIGAFGPIAGFVVAVAAVAVGLPLSQIIEVFNVEGIKLGSPLIFTWISEALIGPIPEDYDVLLHPIAFAGWIGLFVTALNLIPIGQLDGGHIIYAIFGRHHRTISIAMMVILIFISLYGWPGWLLWALLPMILGINHPPLLDRETPLDRRRRAIGWISLAIFVMTFTPTPFIG